MDAHKGLDYGPSGNFSWFQGVAKGREKLLRKVPAGRVQDAGEVSALLHLYYFSASHWDVVTAYEGLMGRQRSITWRLGSDSSVML
jgi:hypothetical protein